MDATHFRQRAACARELARSGDDVRLTRMLLEVALDLDAEAEAIEANTKRHSEGPEHLCPAPSIEASLYMPVGITKTTTI